MEQKLAYSFYLGSDKNKSKLAKKVSKGNVSGTTSFSNNAIQNAKGLSKVNKHNLRDYDNQRERITTIYGTNDIVEDVKQVYLDEFEQSRIEYNSKTRADRQIKDYFQKVCDSQNDIACEIIIELGDMDFWNDKDNEYRLKMIDVYNEQVKDLVKIVPTFKVANATIHFDETSPHMHIVGIPIIENCTRGMKKQVGKTKLFTKTSLTEIQDKMRSACIKSYNKFYEVNTRLKEKQKGRNQDINVNDMSNYREMKKKLEQEKQKLDNANKQTKALDNKSKDIIGLLDSLKPMPFNKNNSQISNENIEIIKDYIKDVTDVTETVRNVNDLNMAIKDFEHSAFEIESENRSLKYEIELRDENIKKLKDKKYRDEAGLYIIEGVKMIEEAIVANAKIDKIVVCEECLKTGDIEQKLLYEIAKYDCIYVNAKVFNFLTDVVAPQGILAVLEKPSKTEKIQYDQDIILALDGIQDPGNLGTILRTADSVNLKQIIVTKTTADSYNPKVVRSTMGAILRVKVIETDDLVATLKEIKKNKFKVVVTSLDTNDSVYDIEYNKKVIVIGNEANGVSKEVQAIADNRVKIPMLGKTESLNASVATGIMLYEYVRQKINK